MYGKIEPSQAVYSFKDQVLVSCDTGYKVLKVQSAAAGRENTACRVPPNILLSFPKDSRNSEMMHSGHLSIQDMTQSCLSEQ